MPAGNEWGMLNNPTIRLIEKERNVLIRLNNVVIVPNPQTPNP